MCLMAGGGKMDSRHSTSRSIHFCVYRIHVFVYACARACVLGCVGVCLGVCVRSLSL